MAIPYEREAVETAVRNILNRAETKESARTQLNIMHGVHLPTGVRFLDQPQVVFTQTVRSAHFSLTQEPDDPNPMQIHVRVNVIESRRITTLRR